MGPQGLVCRPGIVQGITISFVAAGLTGLRFDYDAAGMKAGTGGAGRASGF